MIVDREFDLLCLNSKGDISMKFYELDDKEVNESIGMLNYVFLVRE